MDRILYAESIYNEKLPWILIIGSAIVVTFLLTRKKMDKYSSPGRKKSRIEVTAEVTGFGKEDKRSKSLYRPGLYNIQGAMFARDYNGKEHKIWVTWATQTEYFNQLREPVKTFDKPRRGDIIKYTAIPPDPDKGVFEKITAGDTLKKIGNNWGEALIPETKPEPKPKPEDDEHAEELILGASR